MTEPDQGVNGGTTTRGAGNRDLDPVMDDDLQGRLEAYAEHALEPDPAAVTRMRAAVMAAARQAPVAGRATRTTQKSRAANWAAAWRAAVPAPRFGRPMLALLGAVLMVGGGAGAALAASAPGGPLYPVRLWAETLTLPTEPAARTEAELVRLQARLDDASKSSAQGNGAGVTAALDAYRAELGEAQTAAGVDPGRLATLAGELSRQRATLNTIASHLSPGVDPAIAAAVGRTGDGIDAVLASGQPEPSGSPDHGGAAGSPGHGQPQGPPASPGNPQPPGLASAGPGPQPHPTAGPAASPGPTPSPRPSPRHSAAPHPTANPAGHNPSARPSHRPTHKPHPTPHASPPGHQKSPRP